MPEGEKVALSSGALEKTTMCKFHAKGRCRLGRACTFAHSAEEVRKRPNLFKTQFCHNILRSGVCAFGDGCKYAHHYYEMRPAAILNTRQAAPGPEMQHENLPEAKARHAPGALVAEALCDECHPVFASHAELRGGVSGPSDADSQDPPSVTEAAGNTEGDLQGLALAFHGGSAAEPNFAGCHLAAGREAWPSTWGWAAEGFGEIWMTEGALEGDRPAMADLVVSL